MSDGSELERAREALDTGYVGIVHRKRIEALIDAKIALARSDPVAIIECEDCNARVLDFNAPKPRSETAGGGAPTYICGLCGLYPASNCPRRGQDHGCGVLVPFETASASAGGGEVLNEFSKTEHKFEWDAPAHAAPEAGGRTGDLISRLHERACSYRLDGPSAEHTAAMLDEAAEALRAAQARIAELERERDEARTWGAELDVAHEAALRDAASLREAMERERSYLSGFQYGFGRPADVVRAIRISVSRLAEALSAPAISEGREPGPEPTMDELALKLQKAAGKFYVYITKTEARSILTAVLPRVLR